MRKGYYMEMWHRILADRCERGEDVVTEEIRILKKDKGLGLIFRTRNDRIVACKFLRLMRKYCIYRNMMLHDIWMETGMDRFDAIRATRPVDQYERKSMCAAEHNLYYYNLYMDETVRKFASRYDD